MVVFHASTRTTPSALKVNAIEWVEPANFSNYEFPGADQQTVDALLGE
jgi:hypothetical protein